MQQLRFSRYFKGLIILLDILIIAGVFVFFFVQRNHDLKIRDVDWEQNALSILLLTLFWILLSGRTKLYDIPRNLTYTLYLERIVTHILIFLFGIILLGKVSNNIFLKNERFELALSIFLIFLLLKSTIFFLLKSLRSMGINFRNIMFLGTRNDAREILENVLKDRTDYGFRIFDYPNPEITISELKHFWKEKGIYTLYMPANDAGINHDLRSEIYRQAEMHKVRIALFPELEQNNFFNYELNYVETQPVLTQAKFPLEYFTNHTLKRIFDIFFSIIILIGICFWLFPIVALLIKLNSKGPVFFVQKRYGFQDQVFSCIKFRTMVVNEESSTRTTQKDDDRITAVGKFLRTTSIDEMPQFINVIMGSMSVVGPRPHMLLIDDYYKTRIGRYAIRSLVKPGITGLAQVNGLRGDYGDMSIEMKKRILADSFYVKNWSMVLDFVIILKTMFLVVTGDKKAG
ncbi:MAG: exopolysaccharide biosynthesis polyprenyl glycosylphosphotransferase [Weeksellaceae bacterium]|nr:exopolysaccharide biosynthesis polyprenyl glycosylphosphotransferase [Weeksellaceae bacterium]